MIFTLSNPRFVCIIRGSLRSRGLIGRDVEGVEHNESIDWTVSDLTNGSGPMVGKLKVYSRGR